MQSYSQPDGQHAIPSNRENDHVLQDILRRAIRLESKVTQLMLALQMESDGRNPLRRR